jgi:phosphotransferase system  glucose/maltose/N-acetylglucosamine-specific IIC component
VLIIVVPHLVGWHWLLHHDHLAGIYAGSLLALGGLAVAWAAPEHRKGALAGIVIGAVLAVIPNL